MKTIVVSGASGLIGRALVDELLASGYAVRKLVRTPTPDAPTEQQIREYYWNPETTDIDLRVFQPENTQPVEAVICLNGAGIGDKPWTRSRKNLLESSRVLPVRTLVAAFHNLPAEHRPRVFLSASAVGIYGANASDANQKLTEEAPTGTDFLAVLCRKWEAEANLAEAAGIRVVNLRTGLVLSEKGGLLKAFRKLYKYGLGAQLGDSENWMPTIILKDYARATLHILRHLEISGPVNLVGPQPIKAKDFHVRLATEMKRPKWLKVPQILLNFMPEQVKLLALANQRVVPEKLLNGGFEFETV